MIGFQHMLDLAHKAGIMLTTGLIRTPPNAIESANTAYGVHAIIKANIITATIIATLHSAFVAWPMTFSAALCRKMIKSILSDYNFFAINFFRFEFQLVKHICEPSNSIIYGLYLRLNNTSGFIKNTTVLE